MMHASPNDRRLSREEEEEELGRRRRRRAWDGISLSSSPRYASTKVENFELGRVEDEEEEGEKGLASSSSDLRLSDEK